jgi:GntR family transcriptional regulator
MEILVDVSDATPAFAQLIAQIKAAILEGELLPGAALPPIRQLANDLQLNHNTVAKAYRRLERDLVIETLGRRGSVVHQNAKANCHIDLEELAVDMLGKCVSSLRDSGLTDSELRNAFTEVINQPAVDNGD